MDIMIIEVSRVIQIFIQLHIRMNLVSVAVRGTLFTCPWVFSWEFYIDTYHTEQDDMLFEMEHSSELRVSHFVNYSLIRLY